MFWGKILIGVVAAQTSPIWGSAYIQMLGYLANRQVIGEGGGIYSIKPQKRIEYKDYTKFDRHLESSGSAMWFFVFGMGFMYVFEPIKATYAFLITRV